MYGYILQQTLLVITMFIIYRYSTEHHVSDKMPRNGFNRMQCQSCYSQNQWSGFFFFFFFLFWVGGGGGEIPPSEKFTSENSLVNLCGLDTLRDIRRDCCHNFVSEWDFWV